jgi:hypothetical protein
MGKIEFGQTVGPEGKQGIAIAVHCQDETGPQVVLTYDPIGRAYRVWDVTADGECQNERFAYAEHQATFRYAEKVTYQMFTSRNQKAPGLSWELDNGARG